ncbi:MAG: type I restriction endonuclease subunit R [Thermodesulfobacteriota bacterium]|nr:type I restriction endonuclease subunit R [Thermodesulfobacteriota bacterium]
MTTPESKLEETLIAKLGDLKYVYRPDIHDRAALEVNFRKHFEALNRVQLTDGEFKRLLDEIITPDVFTAATLLREINSFTRDDGTPLNYTLVNIKDWCKNTFEIVNQLRINTDYSLQRYDVMLLINGIPAVQIELKTLGISPRRAMQQIVDYKKDPGNGYTKTLLCFVQLFIVSNRTETYYFANNNGRHFAFDADENFLPIYQHADEDNAKITYLDDFAESFLPKCTLGTTISRYMVLVASEQKMLMMRPYQIYAVEAIDQCIRENRGNGYIWHTTGSGKTLTSFKASTLLKLNPDIHKCLFVVDRKDLDRQTREEFNRFQEGCVEENTNTAALVRRLISEDYADKVIVTTIQKLGLALDENSKRNKNRVKRGRTKYSDQLAPLSDKRMVFIFDECHRTQFGQTHQTIKDFFPKAQLFGFTGTPIFTENVTARQIDGDIATPRTTQDLFQSELHAYTITHAIEDRNVLKFHVDYFKPDGENPPRPGETLAKRAVINAIFDKHDAATGRRRFNALFATASINDAIEYYALFKQVQAERKNSDPDFVPLKVAAVFSPPAEGNPDVKQLQEDLPQELEDNQQEPDKKKEALKAIIFNYNVRYGTNHAIGEFDAYYQDIQKRIKDQQYPNRDLPKKGAEKIDITIVVDMLLTGFDAKYLNTLYVDKNLKHHGLIQVFSRTNRVLNAAKPYGHILDFRGQQVKVDEAITLFSGARAEQAKEIWLVDKAPVVIEQLKAAKQKLDDFLQSHGLEARPEAVPTLRGDDARVAFIKQFKEVQRLATQLDQYTDLTDKQRREIEQTLPKDDARAFRGVYLETAKRLKAKQDKTGSDKPGIDDQVRETPDEYGSDAPEEAIDQLDFEFVLFASADIDYDYIMNLIARFSGQTPSQQEMSREQLIRLIRSDAKFMDELDEITAYVRTLETGKPLTEEEVRNGYQRFKEERHAAELAAVAGSHGLTNEALQTFVDAILDRMIFDGEQLTDLMEPLGLGWRERREKELALMDDLVPLLKKRAAGRTISGLNAYEQ